MLQEPAAAAGVASRAALFSEETSAARQRVAVAQQRVAAEAEHRGARVLDSTQVILNSLFVMADAEQAAALARLPGVARVQPAQPVRRAAYKAMPLIRLSDAWKNFNGGETAGAGSRIGIIDSGIDHTHPAFQDAGFQEPSGGRICGGPDCDYTNRKIVVARSYVKLLAESDDPNFTRPDDLSPRDRVGHGTAVAMLAAGVPHDSPAGRLSGVAPRAWLGNYKVFGSPGVNDVTFDFVVFKAIEEALLDQMDVVTLSLSFPAIFGPNDLVGTGCDGQVRGEPCDPWVRALGTARQLGMAVVAAAGNEGDLALHLPAWNSIQSPGITSETITVGASTNSHILYNSVTAEGSNVPEPLKLAPALFGDGPRPAVPLRAPLVDVASLGSDGGQACSPLPRNSLRGSIALVAANGCSLRVKVNHAQNAGARAVLLTRPEGRDLPTGYNGLSYTAIPLANVGFLTGRQLRAWLASGPGEVTLNPNWLETDSSRESDRVAYFSSRGPNIGTLEVKPDLVAPGTDMFVATQRFDPQGDMYSASGFTVVQGTSFAVPLVAGAVALSRQLFPDLANWPARKRSEILKSSVVNTADPSVYDLDSSGKEIDAPVAAMGAGRLDAAEALITAVTVAPASLSFGRLTTTTFPQTKQFVFRNHVNRDIQLSLSVKRYVQDANTTITITPASFSLRAGQESQPVSIRIDGRAPAPGQYDGAIVVQGTGAEFTIPFLYLVSDEKPYNLVPVRNYDFLGEAGRVVGGTLAFKVLDRYGVPVGNVPVRWTVQKGGGSITYAYPSLADPKSDANGVADAEITLGDSLGEQVVEASLPTEPTVEPLYFVGNARLVPVIESSGVVNAASGRAGEGLAPGSIISIFGRGLSEFTLSAAGPSLPLSLGGISVSFDEPSRRLSLPARMVSVSDSRIDVQLPWELEDTRPASIITKVSLDGFTSSGTYRLALANYSPAFWLSPDSATDELWIDARAADGTRINSGNRARRGALVRLRANGLGPVSNRPASGDPPAAELSSRVQGSITVKLGEREIPVESASLLAGAAGIYEVVIRIPEDLAAGRQTPVTMTVAGVSSPSANLPIQE